MYREIINNYEKLIKIKSATSGMESNLYDYGSVFRKRYFTLFICFYAYVLL